MVDLIRTVADEHTQHVQANERIADSISTMAQVSRDAATQTMQVNQAVTELTNRTVKLQHIIQRFEV